MHRNCTSYVASVWEEGVIFKNDIWVLVDCLIVNIYFYRTSICFLGERKKIKKDSEETVVLQDLEETITDKE